MCYHPISHLARLAVVGATLGCLAAGALYHTTLALATETQNCPNEQLRAESDANPLTLIPYSLELPDCRAYELATPPYTEGDDPLSTGANFVSADGQRFITGTFGNFSGNVGQEDLGAYYEYTRTPSGWGASPLAPPNGLSATKEFGFDGTLEDVNRDFTKMLFHLRTTLQSPKAGSFYLRDAARAGGTCPPGGVLIEEQDACLVEVGPLVPPALTAGPPSSSQAANEGTAETGSKTSYVGASSDFSHVLFTLEPNKAVWLGDTTEAAGGATTDLYEYAGTTKELGEAGREPVLVGVSNTGALHGSPNINDDADLISNCGTALGFGSVGGASGGDKYNAVSTSGEMVFFTAAAEVSGRCTGPKVGELYARINGAATVAISSPSHPLAQGSGTGPEECDAACEAAAHKAGVFQGASENGEKVFFLTEQPLLNSDTDTKTDLYEEEIKGGSIDKVIQVSHDPLAGQAAEVQGVVRVSETGERVYFVAKGELASNANADAEKAKLGDDNLYVYERDAAHPTGELTFIATLSSSDSSDWKQEDDRPAQATPNGEFLAFQSYADLTPGDTSTVAQIFEYDAHTSELVRVSSGQCPAGEMTCPPSEAGRFNADGNTTVTADAASINSPLYTAIDHLGVYQSSLAISEDGAYVFFTSADGLTPNAAASQGDVYEYHWQGAPTNGNVDLLGNGQEILGKAKPAIFLAAGASGSDVLFDSPIPLVGQDTDTQRGFYDARIEGGFPAPVATPACAGEACHGSVLAPLSSPIVGSTTPPAVGNLTTPPEKKTEEQPPAKETTGKVKITKHSVKGKTIVLKLKAPGKGKLTATGNGIKKATKTVKGAASYKLKLKLTKAEQRKLHNKNKRHNKLKLKVRVNFKPASGKSSSASVKVKLPRP